MSTQEQPLYGGEAVPDLSALVLDLHARVGALAASNPGAAVRPRERAAVACLPEYVSIRQAASALGVSRTRTLGPDIAAGRVRTVPVKREKGERRMIPKSEVERLAEEGIPVAPARARPTNRTRKARGDAARRIAAIDLDAL